MPKKKNPSNNYFHEGIEEAIQLYNKAETQTERDKLFIIIYPAISKIAEVMFNKIKPTYIDDEPLHIQMDCTSYLTERLYRIKEGKGKAFSYMTVCARNYYIYHNQKSYTGVQKVIKLDTLNQNWDVAEDASIRASEMEQSSKLLSAFVNYLDENKEKLSCSNKGVIVISALVDFLRDVDSIEDFNRRNIMNDLTEINGYKVDRHYITKVFNKIETHYILFRKEWDKSGKSMPYWSKKSLTKDEIDFCTKNFNPVKNSFSVVGLAKKFSVDEYAVRRELHKVGLASL